MPKISDSPQYIINDFLGSLDSYNHVYPNKAHLIGGNRGIVSKYGFGTDIFVEGEEKYYRIRCRFISCSLDNNLYSFHIETDNYKPSELEYSDIFNYW